MYPKWISTLVTLLALCCCMMGCGANRFQHAADKSLLIQENLQLDQALSITQYELMLAQQENDALRRQLDQMSQNSGNMSGGTSGGVTNGRMPPLRSTYEPMGMPATFDAQDPNLPSPSNQLPPYFQRPPQNPISDYQTQSAVVPGRKSPVIQASRNQYIEVPSGAPQWSPQRVR